jgi:hypothetical protein
VRRYPAELITIVAGILLALLADAWWDRRGDRGREHGYLTDLRGEFEASAQELSFDQRNRTVILSRIERILGAGRARSAVPLDSVPGWTVALVDFYFFSPPTAVLDDLLDSGNLGLIRSDELRYAIQRYGQEMDRLDVVERRERDFIASQLEPWVARSLRMDAILPLSSYDHRPEQPAAEARAFEAMIRNDTFASLAFMRWERTETAQRFATGMGHAIDEVLDRLDRELGREQPDQGSAPK